MSVAAVMRYLPPEVGVLILYVDHQESFFGAFYNTIQAALRGSDTVLDITGRQIDKALAPDQSLCDWIEFPAKSHLMVILITETSENGWWTNHIGTTYDREELTLLWNLFVEDEDIYRGVQRFRSKYMFVVSCGTNLTEDKSLPVRLHQWNRHHELFDHIVCFLNTRLRIQETMDMFGMFSSFAYQGGMTFKDALLNAWAADRHARYHTGLLWITSYKATPKVIRLHGRFYPYGQALPPVSWYCKCDDPTKNWQSRAPRKQPNPPVFWWQTSCCRLRVTLRFGETPPALATAMDVQFIFDDWPAAPVFQWSVTTAEEREADALLGDAGRGELKRA